MPSCLFVLWHFRSAERQDARDEKPREEEEQINSANAQCSDVPADAFGECDPRHDQEVVQHHEKDGESAQPVERRNVIRRDGAFRSM
jgi:hypothetical protein